MKVLITGASGLIGTELVKSYLTKRVGVNSYQIWAIRKVK